MTGDGNANSNGGKQGRRVVGSTSEMGRLAVSQEANTEALRVLGDRLAESDDRAHQSRQQDRRLYLAFLLVIVLMTGFQIRNQTVEAQRGKSIKSILSTVRATQVTNTGINEAISNALSPQSQAAAAAATAAAIRQIEVCDANRVDHDVLGVPLIADCPAP